MGPVREDELPERERGERGETSQRRFEEADCVEAQVPHHDRSPPRSEVVGGRSRHVLEIGARRERSEALAPVEPNRDPVRRGVSRRAFEISGRFRPLGPQ